MQIREKTAADFHALEQTLDVRFFHDAGRTAIAASLHTAEAEALAKRNPFRNQIFRQIVRSAASNSLETDRPALDTAAKRLGIINHLEEYAIANEIGLGDSKLSSRQHDVIHDTVRFLRGELSDNEGMTQAGHIVMPTGAGKTVVFSELLNAIHSNQDEERKIKSLVLVPKKEILAQTIGSTETGQGLATFAPELSVSAYYGEEKDTTGEVVVMTYSSFNRALATEKINPSDYDVLICDEAHRALGETTKRNVDEFRQDKLAIGLTATAAFGSNKRVESIFPTRIHYSDLRETIEQGTLSPVQAWLYKTGAGIDIEPGRFDYTPQELERMANLDERNVRGVEFAKGFIQEGMQGIISCLPGEELWHAKHIADLINSSAVTDSKTGETRLAAARHISGTMSMDERTKIYAAYNRGEIDVLTFVDTINEGWDNANAKFLINLRPTCSPVLGTQRLGRILRPGENPETVAQVVDFIDETKKAQFTALHALQEYRYVLGQVYGSSVSEGGIDYRKIQIPPELRDSIVDVSHLPVKDIVVGRKYDAEHVAQVTIEGLAHELGVNPYVVLFVARELGIDMDIKFGGITSPSKINFSDQDRERLVVAVNDSYLNSVDPEVVKILVQQQSSQISIDLTNNDRQRQLPGKSFYDDMPGAMVLKNIIHGRVAYSELSSRAKEHLINEISIREITDVLFQVHGYENEALKRAALVELAKRADGAAQVLNCAQSIGLISQLRQYRAADDSSKWIVSITGNDGKETKLATTQSDEQERGVVARYRVLANWVGQLEMVDKSDIEINKIVHTKRPIQIVREFSQMTDRTEAAEPIQITTEHVVGGGKNAVYISTIRIVRNWNAYESTGTGKTAKEAEDDAARNMLETSDIEDATEKRRAKNWSAAANKSKALKSPTSVEKFFNKDKRHPNLLIMHYAQKGNISDVTYETAEGGEAGQPTRIRVSFNDSDGNRHSFVGEPYIGNKSAKISASKKALTSEPLVSLIPGLKEIVEKQ